MFYYSIKYTDAHDEGCPVFGTTVCAEDSEWAEQTFWDTCHETDMRWRILEITKLGCVEKKD